MRFNSVLLFFMAFACASVPVPRYLWVSADNTFSCVFPMGYSAAEYKPQRVYRKDITEWTTLHVYMAKKNRDVAIIAHFKISPQLRKRGGSDEAILKETKDTYINKSYISLIDEKRLRVGPYHGLEYSVRIEKGELELVTRTRLIIYKDTLILMTMGYDGNALNSKESNYFFNSIGFTPSSAVKKKPKSSPP